MSYTFGWWDYAEGKCPAMVNRFTGERIVKGAPLSEHDAATASAAHPDTAATSWIRFDYEHDEFCFPLAVFWQPQQGRIRVDYNISTEIWRRESNTDAERPPYGGWVRVDDIVPDAFWCWPGVLEVFAKEYEPIYEYERPRHNSNCHIRCVGGWLNGRWNEAVEAVDHIGPLPISHYIVDTYISSMSDEPWKLPEGAPVLGQSLSAFRSAFENADQQPWSCFESVESEPPSSFVFEFAHPDDIAPRLATYPGSDTEMGRYYSEQKIISTTASDMPDGRISCVYALDGRSILQPHGHAEYEQRYLFTNHEGRLEVHVSEKPVHEWAGGDKGFYLKQMTTRDWEAYNYLRQNAFGAPPLPDGPTPRMYRDWHRRLTDAFSAWTGTDEKPPEWQKMGGYAGGHRPKFYYTRWDVVNGFYGCLAGKQCYRRARRLQNFRSTSNGM